MKTKLSLLLIILANFACGRLFKSQKTSLADCPQRLEGEWQFGKAPYGCSFNAQINTDKYTVFNDANEKASETKVYVKNMKEYISKLSTNYLKRRNPIVADTEIQAWNQFIFTTAQQESYWSHYRVGRDGRMRFFKGDHDHGHGLMQIDDRSHKEFIRTGDVYDLDKHLIYAMDQIYSAWTSSQKSPCPHTTDYASLSRSTYSIYNGGSFAKCRWQNSNDKWSKNDQAFWQKYKSRDWESF